MSLKNIIVHSSVYHGELELDTSLVTEFEDSLKVLHRIYLGKHITLRGKKDTDRPRYAE